VLSFPLKYQPQADLKNLFSIKCLSENSFFLRLAVKNGLIRSLCVLLFITAASTFYKRANPLPGFAPRRKDSFQRDIT